MHDSCWMSCLISRAPSNAQAERLHSTIEELVQQSSIFHIFCDNTSSSVNNDNTAYIYSMLY